MLQYRIFHPLKRLGKKLTPSEKIDKVNFYLFIALILSMIIMYFTKEEIKFVNYFIVVLIFSMFALNMLSGYKRINEYENINGYFDGFIYFHEDHFQIKDQIIQLNQIVDFDVVFTDYAGQSTGNHKTGPMYRNGIKNRLFIKTVEEEIEIFFQFPSEREIERLEIVFFEYLCQNKLPFKRKNLKIFTSETKKLKSYIEKAELIKS